jgi:hypothetical protein
MKNAHLRFGQLTYTRVTKKSSTQFRLSLDRFIGEPQPGATTRAHLLSVIGGDTQIAAVHAAIAGGEVFSIEAPDRSRFRVCVGTEAECFRGSLRLGDEQRPLRHLLAISQELSQAGRERDSERTILFHDSASFLWTSLAHIHGLPGIPPWAEWMAGELKRLKKVQQLLGIGCQPVLVKGGRGLLLNCIGRGLRRGALRFPKENGPIEWPCIPLSDLLLA